MCSRGLLVSGLLLSCGTARQWRGYLRVDSRIDHVGGDRQVINIHVSKLADTVRQCQTVG
ncbi:hypothetical protein AM571_PB00259 (plasmid) [Rhizobium etli 8C-3]|uniref:Lipoprotein n=1 Tax=Rhizobium etli 8C-3 TaxID=538025 RepID=A0A1L5PBP9_RHIET|nr:hypothetical protein AM571_PB00259 [Rhizobium etli 8C-3]